MRQFGKISTSIWQSEKFSMLTDQNAKLLYFYFHTSPHGNAIGCYRVPIGYISEDVGLTDNAIRLAIDSLSEANLIAFDCKNQVVLVTNFLDHSPLANAKHIAGAFNAAKTLPDCALKARIVAEICARHPKFEPDEWVENCIVKYDDSGPDPYPIDSQPIGYGITETETETETETGDVTYHEGNCNNQVNNSEVVSFTGPVLPEFLRRGGGTA